MCAPSKVASDWVQKGFHVRLLGVELAVRPDHLGGIAFRSVFSGPANTAVNAAIRVAWECVANAVERDRWIRDAERARSFLCGQRGELTDLANGRMAELTFLLAALRRMT